MRRILKITLAGAAGALAGVAAWVLPSRRVPPAERERRRRLLVNQKGRIGGATIADFRDEIVLYSYWIGGIHYTACQDLSTLMHMVPHDLTMLIEGPAMLKYLPRNPANSIVLCEEWSGLRFPSRPAPEPAEQGPVTGGL